MSGDGLARSVMARCDTLGGFSEEAERLTRRFATAPMREVNARVAAWMRAAGMDVRQDAVGNIIGRYEGRSADAPILLLGSHLDTVRDAGKYDGPLASACLWRWRSTASPTRRAYASTLPTSAAPSSPGRSRPPRSRWPTPMARVWRRRSALLAATRPRCKLAPAGAPILPATWRSTSSRGRCWRRKAYRSAS